jgi:hypothetical protein
MVFHFLFFACSVLFGYSWFRLKKQNDVLEQALIPFLAIGQVEWPKHKSLILQNIEFLKQALEKQQSCRVDIVFDKKEGACDMRKALHPLFGLWKVPFSSQDPCFVLNEKELNLYEMQSLLKSQNPQTIVFSLRHPGTFKWHVLLK